MINLTIWEPIAKRGRQTEQPAINRAQDGAEIEHQKTTNRPPIEHKMVQQEKREEREEGRWGGAHTNACSPAAQNPKSKKIKMFGLNKPCDKILEFTPHFSL